MNKNIKLVLFTVLMMLVAEKTLCQDTNSKFIREQGGEFHLIDRYINQMADSINYFCANGKLPNFLFNKDLDYTNFSYLSRLKGVNESKWLLSLRKAIFARVFNEDILIYIIEYKDERLDQLYDPNRHIQHAHISSPYNESGPNFFWMELSTRELAKTRLEEIREKKENFWFKN